MKDKRLIEAKQYLNYCVRHGSFELEDIEGMSDSELIVQSDKMMAEAEYNYEAWKEQESDSPAVPDGRQVDNEIDDGLAKGYK